MSARAGAALAALLLLAHVLPAAALEPIVPGGADPHAGHRAMTGADGAADDPHAQHRAMLEKPKTANGSAAEVTLFDTGLLNQDGASLRFASEVVGDRLVVMNFIYTTCTTICPVLTALFGQLQERLGERLGREVFLVSMSVDPSRDTPPRLKAYAQKHGIRDGWSLLTGQKRAMDRVLEGLGAYTPDFTQHPAMILVGDGRSGEWTRYYGFPGPDQIVARLDELVAARSQAQATPTQP